MTTAATPRLFDSSIYERPRSHRVVCNDGIIATGDLRECNRLAVSYSSTFAGTHVEANVSPVVVR